MADLIAANFYAGSGLDRASHLRGDRDWVKFIGPLIFIAVVAHGLWRSRQRREENRTSQD